MCLYGLCGNKYAYFSAALVSIAICMFYFLLASVLLWTHCRNYCANRTTNERFARRRKTRRSESDSNSSLTSSVMSMSDFDDSELMESVLDENKEQLLKKKKNKTKKKGWCTNCWKMAHNTKIVPQQKLYDYLAERSTVMGDSQLNYTNSSSGVNQENQDPYFGKDDADGISSVDRDKSNGSVVIKDESHNA